MTKEAFLVRLHDGLRGLPPVTAAEIIADYEAHFAEGAAAGRTPEAVAAALGDPDRLARELRAEAGLKRWETERNPSSAVAAVFAVLGLGALDLLVLLPVLLGVGGVIFGLIVACIGVFIAGGIVFATGPFGDAPGDIAAAFLTGLGMMSGAASGGAILTLICIGVTNALVAYGRLHYRLLKPAIHQTPDGGRHP
ncbi:MAG TPA: DUF1700 domain-containing protein [Caulobacteraceae bacterium]|nr:DUF1700 domain-containing protein [Caulobacteraceae bacterium]